MAAHQTKYKNACKTAEELRHQRCNVTVQLRKNKRQAAFSERRNLHDNVEPMEIDDAKCATQAGAELPPSPSQHAHAIQKLVARLADPADRKDVLFDACSMLSNYMEPPIEELVNSEVFALIIDSLRQGNTYTLQYNATWALTIIVAGKRGLAKRVAAAGAVPLLLQLVRSPFQDICEQTLWALGNIMADGPELRDYVLQFEGVSFLLPFVKPDVSQTMLRNVVWIVSMLMCDSEAPMPLAVVQLLLPALAVFLQHTHEQLLVPAAWAATQFCTLGYDQQEALVESAVLPLLIKLLGHAQSKVQRPALRAVLYVTAGSVKHAQAALDCAVLSYFPPMLALGDSSTKKETVWCLGNVLCGSFSQIQQVIDCGFLAHIVELLRSDEFKLRREAAVAIHNLSLCGNYEQIQQLIAIDIIEPLCDLLQCQDTTVIGVVLTSLHNMLNKASTRAADIFHLLELCGGLDKIESLLECDNGELFVWAHTLLDQHVEEDT